MADLFASEGMTAFTIAFFGLHVVSLLVLGVVLRQFLAVDATYTHLIEVLRQEPARRRMARSILLWVYAGSTLLIFLVSTVLLLLQPHLL